jgi:hypothetical protein
MDNNGTSAELQSNGHSGFAAQYLLERGIKLETALAEGVEIQSAGSHHRSIYRLRLGFDVWANVPLPDQVEDGLWFPCADANTTIKAYVFRPFPELSGSDGKAVKFLSSKDGDNYPFVPRSTWAAQEKGNQELFVTEGPCKALAILQAGGLPIAVSGVWMATKTNENGVLELHAAIRENFSLRGRTVFLAFDSDYAGNPAVRHALIRTGILFHKAGAEVKVLTWPAEEGKGIDDYLAAKNNGVIDAPKALEVLCANAGPLSCVIRECDLEFVELELSRARLKAVKLAQLARLLAPPLKVSAEALKTSIQTESEQREAELANPEPWPDEVDGAKLADEIVEVIRRHVVMGQQKANAITLWIFLSYLEAAVDCLPILAIRSPEKRCGKTTLLDVLGRLVNKPLQSSNCSVAAIYRVIENLRPTLLIDEVDTWLKDNDEARGVINSGHTRGSAFVLRCNMDSGEPERFSTWAPKVLAGIGRLSDTLADRSIAIQLERRTPKDQVTKLRDVDPAQFNRIAQQLIRWANDHIEELKEVRPLIPNALNDREGDNWFPLLAIAEQIGGHWTALAQAAAQALSSSDDAESIPTQLLIALKGIFDQSPDEPFLATIGLVDELNKEKDWPWADWKHGMTEMKLAQILRQFGIKSERPNIEMEKLTEKGLITERKKVSGYYRKHLKPAFDRYVYTPPPLTSQK